MAVYLHRCSPNNGLTKRDDRDGYRAPYDTPYEMRQIYGKPAIDKDGNAVSYKALSTIYDDSAALNAHTSFPEPEEADPLGLPQDEVHVEALDRAHTEHSHPNGSNEDQSITGNYHHRREGHKITCGHKEHGRPAGGSEGYRNHHHREDHKVTCGHTEHGRPTGGSEGHSIHHHHCENHKAACGHMEHGHPDRGHSNHHHREDHRVACGHTEHGRPNGGNEGHGYHHHKDQSTGSTSKHREFNIESEAARGHVSKATEWRGLAIESSRIREPMRAPLSSLPMAAPESRSRRITRSMATARVAASELLAKALAATAINGDLSSYEEAMASPQGAMENGNSGGV